MCGCASCVEQCIVMRESVMLGTRLFSGFTEVWF